MRARFSLFVTAVFSMSSMIGSGAALADELYFEMDLSGENVVPPVETSAAGTVQAVVDTERGAVTWLITWEGLSGPATSIRIHGPADEGANAPEMLSLSSELVSPINGGTSFGEARSHFFEEGRVYVVIGTAAHPEGELRAQFVPDSVEAGAGED